MGLFSAAPKPHPDITQVAAFVVAKSGRDPESVNMPKLLSVFGKVFETQARKHVPDRGDEIRGVLMQCFANHDLEPAWRHLQGMGKRGVNASNDIVDWIDANTDELIARTRSGQYDK